MKISVIIPTYKPQGYLWECLDSLMNQTLSKQEYEVVLVLNGCTEPWKSQIAEYIKEHLQGMNINFIHTEMSGVSNARNVAIDFAKGDYITFLDDDDYFSSITLQRLSDSARSDVVTIFKPLAFYDGSREFFSYSRTLEYEKNCKAVILPFYKVRKNFGGPVMKLFPRQIIGDRRYNSDFKNGEDSLFMFLISDRMNMVNFASEDAIYYRRIRNDSAVTSSKSFMNVFFNSMRLSREYSRIFFCGFNRYNFWFYITRLLGSVRAIINYKRITF